MARILTTLSILAVLAVVPLLTQSDYFIYILSLTLVNAIVVLGLNITNGYLGVFNLAVAGQVGLGAYVCALLLHHGLLGLVPSVVAAALFVAACSALIYLLLAKLSGFFFGLASIAVAEIIRLLLRNLDGITNGSRGLSQFSPIADDHIGTYLLFGATFVALYVLIGRFARSHYGTAARAIRDNADKCHSLGLPVGRYRLLGYTVGGGIIGLGGAYTALLLNYIEPSLAALDTLLQYILMLTLGGLGTIDGALVGSLFITLLPEVLRTAPELRMLLYGLSLIVVVLVVPGGIVGYTRNRLYQRRLHRLNRAAA